ncbi:hypothetical protein DID88_001833 [Monilinia fructigena]|uniref:Uncharacterized protein n=1 Tax=Monilinia fructigena TaxID=38457 RepID=A0A395IVN3_9HELO|nr:hypothetical protein DID88_001833 [Monilinia fructigena]
MYSFPMIMLVALVKSFELIINEFFILSIQIFPLRLTEQHGQMQNHRSCFLLHYHVARGAGIMSTTSLCLLFSKTGNFHTNLLCIGGNTPMQSTI